ncbi:MAG: ABC transporter ATP-binding protein [Microbacter sp.]
MAFLDIQNVTKQYNRHVALTEVSLSIQRHSIYGLLGPNGAGKTTLIRIINQITAPDSGSIFLENKPLRSTDIQRIGYLPEERGLYKKMKVGEQALYLAQLKGMTKTDAMISLKQWFTRLEMQSWWDKKIEDLSKGMQQKVQFIITVVHKPELLIFDEPFSGFDPMNTAIMKQEMLRLRDEGATIIFSTHNMASVEELCNDITLLNRSKVVLQGAVNHIKQQFRTHIYRLVIEGEHDQMKPTPHYRILSIQVSNQKTILRIEPLDTAPNEIIAGLLASFTILSFEEEIPSMNDIFIRIVQNSQSSNT